MIKLLVKIWSLLFELIEMLFFDLCIQGVIQGAIYALIALGLTLVYGLLRILHVAHAALFTLGGYIGVIVTNGSGSFLLALLTSMLIVGVVGMSSYTIIYKPLLNRTPLIALIASIGIFIASEELFRIFFGAYGLSYANPPLQGQIEILPGISLSHARILVVVLAIGLLSGVGWLAINTRVGIAARATVIDPQMAASSGVNVEMIRFGSFFIGSAFAGAAGVMVSLLNNLVEPTMGAVPSYKALAIIVLGGLGILTYVVNPPDGTVWRTLAPGGGGLATLLHTLVIFGAILVGGIGIMRRAPQYLLISYALFIFASLRFTSSDITLAVLSDEDIFQSERVKEMLVIAYAVSLVLFFELSNGVLRFSMLDTSIRTNEVYVMNIKRVVSKYRRSLILNPLIAATFAWFALTMNEIIPAIVSIFSDDAGEPWEVDHIDPLQGELVCGLHCFDNLQVLPRFENRAKQNKFTPYRIDTDGNRYELSGEEWLILK